MRRPSMPRVELGIDHGIRSDAHRPKADAERMVVMTMLSDQRLVRGRLERSPGKVSRSIIFDIGAVR